MRRLKAEIDAMFIDGEYREPEKWDYPAYLSGQKQPEMERER